MNPRERAGRLGEDLTALLEEADRLEGLVVRLAEAGQRLAAEFDRVREEVREAAIRQFGSAAGLLGSQLDPRIEQALDDWREVFRRATQK